MHVYKLPNRTSYLEAIARMAGLYYHGKLEHDRVYDRRSAIRLGHGFAVLEARRMDMLPLTLPGKAASIITGGIWATNRALSAVPGLNLVATNIELVARSPHTS